MGNWLRIATIEDIKTVEEAWAALIWRPELAEKYPQLVDTVATSATWSNDLLRNHPELIKYPKLIDAIATSAWNSYYLLYNYPELAEKYPKLIDTVATSERWNGPLLGGRLEAVEEYSGPRGMVEIPWHVMKRNLFRHRPELLPLFKARGYRE